MAQSNEVSLLRLYVKIPGTDVLRKEAAAELRRALAKGWQETDRKVAADHVVVQLERPAAAPLGRMHPSPPRRPR